MIRMANRKHSLHEIKVASVLLKLLFSGYERCPTTEAPSRMSGTLKLSEYIHVAL